MLPFTEQLIVGEHIAQKLLHVRRTASVVKTATGNSVSVARRRGISMRSFKSEEAALAWLSEDD